MTSARIEIVPYGGWEHNLRLSNGTVEVLVTLDVGPRILRYAPSGGTNVLKELPDQLGRSGEDRWVMRGGHRLWTSPEDPQRTYVPDNQPVTHQLLTDGAVRVSCPADVQTGLERTMDLHLDALGSRLRIAHRIVNHGAAPVRIAAWALTVLAPGGLALVPLPPFSPHPGDNARSPADFAPQMTMATWPYFRFPDPRLTWGNQFLRVRQDRLGPCKFGFSHRPGWAGYLRDGVFFVKTFSWDPGAQYPDGGCNFECYTDEGILELESLGPLTTLAPGQHLQHDETWSLHQNVSFAASDPELARQVGAWAPGSQSA